MRHKLKGGFVLLVAALALGGLTAASALAAGAPTAETKPAGTIFGTEATLKGKVNPNGATTKYYFEYGTTTGYGTKTLEVTLKSRTIEVEVSKLVEGLTPSTKYHFRVVATNEFGTSDGADQAFTTASAALPEFSEGKPGYKIGIKTNSESGVKWSGSGSELECSSDYANAEITGPKTISYGTMIFQGCKIGKHGCNNTTGTESIEEIRTTALEGKLVYLSKTAKTVAILFKPMSGVTVATNIKCGIREGEVRGSILMPLTKVNTLSNEFKLTSNVGTESYESESGGKLSANLTSELFSGESNPIYWTFTDALFSAVKIEVKA
jgi:hypothetical protein